MQHRLLTCQQCPNWNGSCGKGHQIQDRSACPENRFPAYVPLVTRELASTGTNTPQTPKILSWADVFVAFTSSMVQWAKRGFKLVDEKEHYRRYEFCKACDKFDNFRCARVKGGCGCVAFLKAKLATSACPVKKWDKAV